MVFEAVAKMIADQLKVDPSHSANVMVLIMDLEDQYGIQVDDSAIASLKTVGDVVGYIEQKQQ